MKKALGILLMVAGALVFALAALVGLVGSDPASTRPEFPVVVSETAELDRYGAGAFRSGDAPRITLPAEPAQGRLFYVMGEPGPSGDGSRQAPWRTLQDSLCRLRPGDRLVVLAGGFQGPLAIDGDCADGAPGRPIEVHFWDDVIVRGAAGPSVLSINRSHWLVAGLEILPETVPTAISIAPGVQGIELRMVKVSRGRREAVRVGTGARDVLLKRLHVHHIGFSEADSESTGPGAPRPAAVVIEPDVRGLRIEECKFHQIGGEPIRAIEPASFSERPGLPPAEFVVDEITERPGEGDRWWSSRP